MLYDRIVNICVLPGEPLDGSGRVCIHLFVRDDRGPFVEPNVMFLNEEKRLAVKPMRGRLACDATRNVAPVTRGNVTAITPRSEDPRAVTCPKCVKSAAYASLMARIEAATTDNPEVKRGEPLPQGS